MVELTDELIMAYVDGELEKELARQVREAIGEHPELLRRAQMFRDSANMLQGIYDAPLHEAIPERLIESVKNSQQRNPGLRVRNFLTSFLRIPAWQPAHGVAFILILLFGAAMGYLGSGMISPRNGSFPIMLTSEGFSQGLERTASGRTFSLDGHSIQVTPIATFLDKSGRYCRQYEIMSRKDGRINFAQGVAFRNQSGRWQMWIYVASGSPGGSIKTESNTYVPAGGRDNSFNQMIDQIMASRPLTPQQEKKIIREGWKH